MDSVVRYTLRTMLYVREYNKDIIKSTVERGRENNNEVGFNSSK